MTTPQVSNPTVPYNPVDPTGKNTDRVAMMPNMFCAHAEKWAPILGTAIDEMTSDPRTLDLLSAMLPVLEPKVIVEVGTYRGWGCALFAETLVYHRLPGHVWSCDPVDHGVQEMLDRGGLTDRVTLVQGTFEHLLAQLQDPIDFCYIDASDIREPSLRLRYTKLALTRMSPGGVICVDDAAGDWKGCKTLRRMAQLYLPHLRGLAVVVK